MPAYSGKFEYRDESGAAVSSGPCQFQFDAETAIVTPASGTPIAFDLGDVDRAVPGDWDFQLALFTGRRLELRQFGAAFSTMREELLAAWRDRTVRCLLLEDLEEVGRYTGTAALGGPAAPAQVRLYRSNLAVLPLDGAPVQWRLADVDAVSFDEAAYSVTLESGGERLTLAKLAKKTDEFRDNLDSALDALRTRQAEAMHSTFPFLDPDQLQRVPRLMPEGRSAPLAALRAIHPKLLVSLIARVVDAPLRPYFDALCARSAVDSLMTGYKFIRPDEEQSAEEGEAGDAAAPAAAPPETQARKATKKGRTAAAVLLVLLSPGRWPRGLGEPPEDRAARLTSSTPRRRWSKSIARLTRGLALVNFRREPVYLPDESLERQPRFRRYAIGCRKLPDLRLLRAAFRGRAIHTPLEAWTAQVEAAGVAGVLTNS